MKKVLKAKVVFDGAVADEKGCTLVIENNEPLTVGNMTELTDEQVESLECGDVVLKEDASGKHAYLVSYKKAGVGICITYTDASVVETVSYDYTEGHWVYNSTDVTHIAQN